MDRRLRVAAVGARLVEGGTVAIEYRWGGASVQRYAEIAAEFVRLNVDVILTYGTPAAPTAKKVTSVVPIVFALTTDPVGSGPVASLAQPGGNITGMSTQHADFASKRPALLREVIPGLRRLAVIVNVGNSTTVRVDVGDSVTGCPRVDGLREMQAVLIRRVAGLKWTRFSSRHDFSLLKQFGSIGGGDDRLSGYCNAMTLNVA